MDHIKFLEKVSDAKGNGERKISHQERLGRQALDSEVNRFYNRFGDVLVVAMGSALFSQASGYSADKLMTLARDFLVRLPMLRRKDCGPGRGNLVHAGPQTPGEA